MGVIYAVLILGGLGLLFGVILGIASKVFHVDVDPKITEIRGYLPGANCGACGFPGCDGMAKAIVAGSAPVNGCPVCNSEGISKIGEVMGVAATLGEKRVAHVMCKGCDSLASKKYDYSGVCDCRTAIIVAGGDKSCDKGCMGYGTCMTACDFGAISIVDGVAVIDKDKCVTCGKCIAVCPKTIISMVSYAQEVMVECKNTDFGKATKDVCKIGCFGCKLCEKTCPFEAIKVENNLARIDYAKCKQCMACTAKCPVKAISGDLTNRKKAVIEKEKCIGCTICAKKCPVEAIEGDLKSPHKVIEDKCIGCGECVAKCPKKAIEMK